MIDLLESMAYIIILKKNVFLHVCLCMNQISESKSKKKSNLIMSQPQFSFISCYSCLYFNRYLRL